MIKVAGVRFKEAGKVYYFDPGPLPLAAGDEVIVETARGLEYGQVASAIQEVTEEEVTPPLRPVLRLATEADRAHYEENRSKREEALQLCQEKVDKHGLAMKLVDVEYTFDNAKIIFYFTADGRVDFRELVKDLAAVFRTRIELRQIGVRDETKLMGGIGICGRPLCCHAWMADFEPVSIKMAKMQNLSLNPIKISGTCGRLMCCLQFENAVYVEMRKGMPEVGERIVTRDGKGVVVDVNVLGDKIKTRLILEEESQDSPLKLSSEASYYSKEDVLRREAGSRPEGRAGGRKNRGRGRETRRKPRNPQS